MHLLARLGRFTPMNAIEFCRDLGLQEVIFEGDVELVVKKYSSVESVWADCRRHEKSLSWFPYSGGGSCQLSREELMRQPMV
jgi:hypothetical protein